MDAWMRRLPFAFLFFLFFFCLAHAHAPMPSGRSGGRSVMGTSYSTYRHWQRDNYRILMEEKGKRLESTSGASRLSTLEQSMGT